MTVSQQLSNRSDIYSQSEFKAFPPSRDAPEQTGKTEVTVISGPVKDPVLFRSLAPPPSPLPPCCIFTLS